MIQQFLDIAKTGLEAGRKSSLTLKNGKRGVQMPDGTFYPWNKKGEPTSAEIQGLNEYHAKTKPAVQPRQPYQLTTKDNEPGVFTEDGAFYPWKKNVAPSASEIEQLKAYHQQHGKWEYAKTKGLNLAGAAAGEFVPGSVRPSMGTAGIGGKIKDDPRPARSVLDLQEYDSDEQRLRAMAASKNPVLRAAASKGYDKLDPQTPAALADELKTALGFMGQGLSEGFPRLATEATERLGQALYGAPKGWFKDNPQAVKDQKAITGAAQYLVPGLGQAALVGQALGAGSLAMEVGPVEAVKQIGQGVVQQLNPFEQGLSNTERGVRAFSLIATFGAAAFKGKALAENAVLTKRLVKEYGFNPKQAATVVNLANQAIRESNASKGAVAGTAETLKQQFQPKRKGETVRAVADIAYQRGVGQAAKVDPAGTIIPGTGKPVADVPAAAKGTPELERYAGGTRTYGAEQPGPTTPSAPVQPRPATVAAAQSGTSVVRKSAEGNTFTETRVDPNLIGVKPGLQYKKAGIVDDANAVTGDLKNVKKYDQATAGPLTVWQTTDGKLWALNGHHRRELAIRTNEPDVPIRIFKEEDGVDFKTARALGALQNIRDGKGTAIDAATILRDLKATPEKLAEYGLNTRSGVARDAISLVKLDPKSLKFVEEAQVSEAVAAGIADAGLDARRTEAVMKLAAKSDLETRNQGALLADRAKNAPMVDRSGGMGDLFGEIDEGLALAEQAKLADNAMRRLSQSQRALTAFNRAKAVGSTYIDKESQSQAAAIQEFGRRVIATDKDAATVLEQEAANYARSPSKQQLEQSTAAIVRAAEEAAERRLAELQPNRLGPSADNGDGGRTGSGQTAQAAKVVPSTSAQRAPKPKKPLADMSADEVDAFREEVRAYDKGPGSYKAILGDKYPEWKKLDDAGDYGAIEKYLTESEYQRVYMGEPGQMFLEDVDQFITDTNSIATAKTPKELGFWLRNKLARPMDNAQAILVADKRIKDMKWDKAEVEEAAMVAHLLRNQDAEGTAFLYGKSLDDVVAAARRFVSGEPPVPDTATTGKELPTSLLDVEPELKLEADAPKKSQASITKQASDPIAGPQMSFGETGDRAGQFNIFSDPDGTIKLNAGIDITKVLKHLNDLDYKLGGGTFKTERPDTASGYGIIDRFRMPLSIIDGEGKTLQTGTYERLAGPLGKKASEAIRDSQIEIDKLTTEWERGLDVIESLMKGALKDVGKSAGIPLNPKSKKVLTSKLIEIIESDLGSPERAAAKGDLAELIKLHDELTETLRAYIIESRNALGIDTPDDWGITEQGYFRHLFLGDIRMMVDGNFVGTARTYAEAQKMAVDIHRQFPDADIVAQGRVMKGAEDVLRVSTKRYAKVAKGIADSVGVPMSEIMNDIKGEIGQRSKKLKFFGALKQRTGAEGYSTDYLRVMRMHVAQVARTQELSKLNRALVPIAEKIRENGMPGLANAIYDHLDSIWGTPTSFERSVGDSIRNTPVLRNYVGAPDFAMRGLAIRLTKLQTALKLSYNVRSSLVNLIQPYSTLWPYVSTRDFVDLYGDLLRKDTRKMLRERGIVEGETKVEESATGIKPKFKTPFRAASGLNRAMGYLYGYRTGLKRGMSEAAAHKSGLAWAEKVEFDNSAWNGAPVLRSPQARVLGQFKGFMFKNLEHLGNATRKRDDDQLFTRAGRISKLAAAQIGTGGLKGLGIVAGAFGGYKIVEALVNQFQQLGMSKEQATELAELAYYGAPSLVGEDLSSSVAILETPYGNTPAEQLVNFVFGPTINTGLKVAQEGQKYVSAEDKQGESGGKGLSAATKRERAIDKGMRAITPYWKQAGALWDLIESPDGSTNLVVERPKNENANKKFKQGDVSGAETLRLSPFESVMMALGFTPLKQSRYYDRKNAKIKEGAVGTGVSSFQENLGQAVSGALRAVKGG